MRMARPRGRLPTPPGTRYRGADGEEYEPETNVAPGAAGSKVILWARGSAFMATQSADFLWFLGLFLSQQTLAGAPRAFGNEGGNYFPAALDGWVRTYASLVGIYGAENVVVAGDSAGAGLTLATLLDALCHLDTPLPAPAGMLLFSPFCDISDDSFDPAKAPARLAFHAKEGGLQKYGGSDYLPFPGYRYPCVAYGSAAQRRTSLASPGRASKEELDALLRSGVKILLNFGGMELLQSQQRHLAAELAAAACRVKGTGSFDHFVIRGGTHDLPVLGLPLIQNTAFCAANQPRDSPVCEAWFRALKWLADDLGWDASGMSALEDWAPTSPASLGVRARAEGSCSKWSTDWEDY